MQFSADPIAALMPAAACIRGDEPVTASTAILLCIRNEWPERMIRNLEPMLAGLDAAGFGRRFHLYVLSDTNDPVIAGDEEACFAALTSRWRDQIAITYRRRVLNTAYKAGNIREFCERWGDEHEFAVTLDADSFMTAEAVLRLVRIMQLDPRTRHPSRAGRRPPLHQCLCAPLSVRHAAWHALLYDRQFLVAGRLRALLGPQRGVAARAVHRALHASRSFGEQNGRSPHPQP